MFPSSHVQGTVLQLMGDACPGLGMIPKAAGQEGGRGGGGGGGT